MKRILSWIPRNMLVPLLVTIAWNMAVYAGSRLLNGEWYHYNMELPLDRMIPFMPWTVSIYLICYLFWVVNYILAVRQSKEEACRFLSAELLAKTGCLICFLLLPTTNIRPEVGSGTIWQSIMSFVYTVDAADNLFPSIHCLVSWFCFIAVRKNEKIPKWYQLFSLVFALMVCLSTLTTRQHVFVDTVSGVLLAELCYWLTEQIGFSVAYRRLFRIG